MTPDEPRATERPVPASLNVELYRAALIASDHVLRSRDLSDAELAVLMSSLERIAYLLQPR